MTDRRWELIVHDARGRRRRGTVVWCGRLPSPLPKARTPTEFVIVLLSRPAEIAAAPPATAVCVPAAAPVRAGGEEDEPLLPERIEDLRMTLGRMALYRRGRLVMPCTGTIAADDVFPAHSERPRLDRLALALLEAADAEALAPYTGLIRHELKVAAGSDPLAALAGRLAPADPAARPPARAPAVRRLAAALRALREGRAPDIGLDAMAEDLRFLRLFEDDVPFPDEALDRLLADVSAPAPKPARRPRARSSKVVPLRPRRTGEDR